MVMDYKEKLSKYGVIALIPQGNSMWPTLKGNKQSIVIVKKTARLKKLDVALFVREGVCVLHRVMEVKEDGYICCGDSQTEQENVKEENVIGVLAGFYRKDKYIDVKSKEYKEEVKKLYSNEKRRRRKIKLYTFYLAVVGRMRSLFKRGKSND